MNNKIAIKKLYKKIKKIVKEERVFLPYQEQDSIDNKVRKTIEYIDSTYLFVKEEVQEIGYEVEDWLVSFDWGWVSNNAISDDEYHLKRLYLNMDILYEFILPKLEKIQELEK